ncbi:uncharacterized protein DUF4114 [Lutibacter sp. Hel_I_33_5]|uniref:DUF4114 domain-containing protein n=1 Tax=Lutibacter sp. Hel_I_33_5 TaxID=1566289 RepID=UPI0011AABEF7|nr:DUF4114 domain-containing protein [Lutibacter sp. Hel_I_33_5]TVZ56419.1 uncharacterized protein DUF4114 [Lutibacter sp. Hel_I_33_5]
MKTKIMYLFRITKKMKLYSFIILIIFSSCQTTIEEDALIEAEIEEVPYKINNSTALLSSRINYINRTATIKPIISGLSNGRLQSASNVNGAQELYYWEHVAEVAPLVLQGKTLSATHITLNDDKAYVSYHKQGDEHLGAVEIIDLTNANFPEISTQATFLKSDINAITSGFSGNSSARKVWLAMSDATHGGQLIELETSNGLFTENYKRVNLSNIFKDGVSASANGIAVTDDYLYVTSGKTFGGTIQLRKSDLSPISSEKYSNAKYVAVNGTSNGKKVVSLVTGDNAKIKVDNVDDNLTTETFTIGEIFHQNVVETYRGKSTMEFSPINDNQLYIAKGKDGLALVDVTNGTIKNESKGTMLVAGNTNGVSTDIDYVYAANGSDGISISPHPTTTGEKINPVFYWDLAEEDASANYIIADGEWVFVAKGNGGFKILRKRKKDEYKTITTYNNNGKPDGLEEDKIVCSTLLPNIYANVLPERRNAMRDHPEYFSNPVKNIVVTEETELSLTFIDEGAGYKNVLGYYTYQEGNKPTAEEQLDKIVIFPNASADRSGGELIRGNTMRLLGNFEPGTVISFFLIANGWRDGKITDGYYSQHTDIEFNRSGRQQSIIFYDATCNSTVIAFEDITVPNGDNDFNDAIFEISASNPNALNTASFNQIGN